MNDDEKVDGPKVAANILNSMPSEQRERLMGSIREKNPDIATKIAASLQNFDDIADLTDQGVQRLVNEIEHKDLVLALKKSSDEVRGVLLRNMSQRKRDMVVQDFEALPPTRVSEVEEAQRKILEKLDDLRTTGQVLLRSDEDNWA